MRLTASRRRIGIALALLVFGALILSCSDDESSETDENAADDDASPAAGDDEANDDDGGDDDQSPSPSLNLPSFPGAPDLYGFSCGHETFEMTANGWRRLPQPIQHLGPCQALDRHTVVSWGIKNPDSDVFLYEDGAWKTLGYQGTAPYDSACGSFRFFDRESGMVTDHLLADGVWTAHPELLCADLLAPDDGAFVGPDRRCLYYWSGAPDHQIVCAPDVTGGAPERGARPTYIRGVRYFASDDIWLVVAADAGESPGVVAFAHWDGAAWNDVFRFYEGWDELAVHWDFADPDHGWALGRYYDTMAEAAKQRVAELSDGVWSERAGPSPAAASDAAGSDHCRMITAAAADEMWMLCSHAWPGVLAEEDYFAQYVDGEYAYWRHESIYQNDGLDLRRLDPD